MRARRVVLALLVLVLVAAIPVAAVAVRGMSADTPPGCIETAIARRLVWLSIPPASRQATSPITDQSGAAKAGAEHFGEHCATCHGRDGRGESGFGQAMYPPVPDLSSRDIQAFSDGALFSIIQHGVRWTGMPAFASSHTPEETWQLVAFIRALPEGRPAATHQAEEHDHGAVGTRAAAANTVLVDGTAFQPAEVTVHAGTIVTWRNEDPFPHNVTSSAGGWHSPDLDPRQSFEWKATTPGTFRYVCTLHPGMKGVVHVQ